jgi:putative molybdopterin biosynthesis protein
VQSERGRREFTLVNLVRGRDGLVAFPLGKGSGSVTTFARADGFFEVPANVEYLEAGEEVTVTLLGRDLEPADLVIIGSHCVGLDVILRHLGDTLHGVKVLSVGSKGGIDAAGQGACDVAPLHLYDAASGAWNEPFAPEGTRVLRGYERRQGLAYRAEHAERFESGTVEDVVQSAAHDPALRLANRNPASGTRVLIDELLAGDDGEPLRPPGWTTTYRTHTAVAACIAQGRGDYGICLDQAARAAGLRWREWRGERYDFVVPADRWDAPGVVAFREALASEGVRAALAEAGFVP